AEIEGDDAGDEAAELDQHGVIEAVAFGEFEPKVFRGLDGQVEIGRVARQAGKEEDENDEANQRYGAVKHTFADIIEHGLPPGSESRRTRGAAGCVQIS